MPDRDPNRAPYWLDGIADWERRSADWRTGSKRIARKFAPKPDRAPRHATLWSHVESALPALYAQPPTIIARRLHRDADPDGRLAAETLQRAATATMEPSGYDEAIGQAAQDLVLFGRGAVWVRYDAHELPDIPVTWNGEEWIAPDGLPVPADLVVTDETGRGVWVGETRDEIALMDYVHWCDLAHSNHQTASELARYGWVARRVLMPPMEFRRRFGRAGKPAPGPRDGDDYGLASSAREEDVLVWEIWDTRSRDRIMVSPGIDDVLDRQRDPYQLPGFLPCAIVWGSRSNENLIPMADWTQVERIADEVEDSSERLGHLIRKLRPRIAYDSSRPQLARLIDGEQDAVGIDSLDTISGDGTIDRVVQALPLDAYVNAATALYSFRDRSLATIRDVGGFGGGAPNPQGTATESRRLQLQSGARLERRRRKVERFARDAARLLVGVTARLVPKERLREQAAFDLLPEVARLEENDRNAAWERVSTLLQSPLSWRVDVETDSTIETDLTIEDRVNALSAIADYLRYMVSATQQDPALAPALGQILLFGTRTWRAGRSVEAALEAYVAQADVRAQAAEAAEQQAAAEPQAELDPEQQQQLDRLLFERARLEEQINAIRQRTQIEGAEGVLRIRREAARAEAAEQRLEDARFRSAQQQEGA